MKKNISIILFFCSIHIFAISHLSIGHETGNGGDSIVCEENGQIKASIYDYYEGKNLYNHYSYSFKKDGSVEEKLDFLLDRLALADPYRAKRYRKWYDVFWLEAEKLYGQSLIDIPDTGLGFIPSHCELVQTIVQVVPNFTHKNRYYINMDVWEKLDDDSKVGFYLHEFILRDAMSSGQKNSVSTRFFNALIAGGYHSNTHYPFSANADDYTNMLKKLNFSFYEIGRIPVPLSSIRALYNIVEASVNNVKYNYFTFEINIDELNLAEPMMFDDALFRGNGELKRVPLDSNDYFQVSIDFSEMRVFQDSDKMELKIGNSSSVIRNLILTNDINECNRTFEVSLKPNSSISFNDEGYLKEVFAEKLVLNSNQCNYHKVFNNVRVLFNEDGTIASYK